jgi:hypothetical protein
VEAGAVTMVIKSAGTVIAENNTGEWSGGDEIYVNIKNVSATASVSHKIGLGEADDIHPEPSLTESKINKSAVTGTADGINIGDHIMTAGQRKRS